MTELRQVAVLGAGHGGQAMAGHLALQGVAVNVYNRSSARLAAMQEQGGVYVEGVVKGFGRLRTITSDLATALADAELIMVVVPASAHRQIAQACAPHLRDGQIIILNPGRTGGALEFAATLRAKGCTAQIKLAETQTLVYSCRQVVPGRVRILSLKRCLLLAALPAADTDEVLCAVGQLYPQFVPAANVLETSFSNIGAVFHPILVIFNANRIEAGERFLFYHDITPALARFLEAVDGERLAVARAFGIQVESASEWLTHAYEGVTGRDLYEKIRSVPAYQEAIAPTSLDDRYLTEDIPTGLIPLIAFAELAGAPMPISRAIVRIAGTLLERDFWAEGRNLKRLGLAGMKVEEIKALVEGKENSKLQTSNSKEEKTIMRKKILGGSLGECVHVAGVLNFLGLAEEQGYQTEFTGPATSIAEYIAAAQEVDPDILAVSYRLTPQNAAILLSDFQQACEEAGLLGKRFVFGGTPPVVETARKTGLFEALFSGEEPPDAVIAYLKGQPLEQMTDADYPAETLDRIAWKAPFPIIRHHFGLPAKTIEPTVAGIRRIAEAGVLDIISLGPDQDAQQNLFHPQRQDPKRKGAGGVPFRSEEDLRTLYAASRCGNYPLMRSYSGTSDLLRYAELLRRTIRNTWCATSLFWFNVMDGRGPLTLRESIGDHMALMKWHGERNIPVEGNEPYHWGLRDAHDAVICADSYIYAHVAKKMGVRDYITTYMFETPPHLSNKMDLAKALAQVELAESFVDEGFHIVRQTRTGLMSYPVDPDYAKGQLAASVYLQMALKPSIVHVVGYVEAHHAATPEDVIESCKMARKVIINCLYGMPDMTADLEVQQRKDELVEEAMVIVEAIGKLGRGKAEDPLTDPDVLARAVEIGLLDAPQLKGNPYACGQVRTRIINGANYAVDEEGRLLSENVRVEHIFARL